MIPKLCKDSSALADSPLDLCLLLPRMHFDVADGSHCDLAEPSRTWI